MMSYAAKTWTCSYCHERRHPSSYKLHLSEEPRLIREGLIDSYTCQFCSEYCRYAYRHGDTMGVFRPKPKMENQSLKIDFDQKTTQGGSWAEEDDDLEGISVYSSGDRQKFPAYA